MRLEWSPLALEDRFRIFDHIAPDDPRAAAALDDRLHDQLSRLAEYPELGRPGRVAGTRELVAAGTPYLAAYRLDKGTIRILRILHGAQLWPDRLDEG